MLPALLLTLCLFSPTLQAAAHSSLQQPLQLHTASGILHGTLLKPSGTAPLTVALLIAGSGPTDRDGNNPEGGHNDSLKRLAQSLTKHSIPSLRYDKRGSGESTGSIDDSTLEDFSADALAGVNWLRRRSEIDHPKRLQQT